MSRDHRDSPNAQRLYPIKKQGNLVKLGFKSHKWQERWFDLQADCLYYYGSGLKIVPNGKIDLRGAQVAIGYPDEPLDPLSVEIPPGPTQPQIIGRHNVIKMYSLMDGIIPRVYYLVCSHELERDEWLLALQNNIVIVNTTSYFPGIRGPGGSAVLPEDADEDMLMAMYYTAMGIGDDEPSGRRSVRGGGGGRYRHREEEDFFEGHPIPDGIGWWHGLAPDSPINNDRRIEIPIDLQRARQDAVNTHSADACRTKGNEAYNAKQWRIAWEWFTRGLELDPNDVRLWSNRAAAAIMFVRSRRWKNIFEWALTLDVLLEACKDAYEATLINPAYTRAWIRLCIGQMMAVPDLLLLPLAAYSEAIRLDPQAGLTSDEFAALFLIPYSLLAKILPLGQKVVPVSYAHVSKNLKNDVSLQFTTAEGGSVQTSLAKLKKHFFTSAYAPPMGDAAYVLYIMYARLRSCFCGCGSSALGNNVDVAAFEAELLDFSKLVPLRALIASPCVEDFLLSVDLRARDLIELQDVLVGDAAKPTGSPTGEKSRIASDNEKYDPSSEIFSTFVATILSRMVNEKVGQWEKALNRLVELDNTEITRDSCGLHLTLAVINVAKNEQVRKEFLAANGAECLALEFAEVINPKHSEVRMDIANFLGSITAEEAKTISKGAGVKFFANFLFPVLDGEMPGCHLYKDIALKAYRVIACSIPLGWIHEGGPDLSSFARYLKSVTATNDLTVPLTAEAAEDFYQKFVGGAAIPPPPEKPVATAAPTAGAWSALE